MLPLLGLAALSFILSGGIDKVGRQFNDDPMDNPSFGDWAGTAAMTGLGSLGGLGPSVLAKGLAGGADLLGLGSKAALSLGEASGLGSLGSVAQGLSRGSGALNFGRQGVLSASEALGSNFGPMIPQGVKTAWNVANNPFVGAVPYGMNALRSANQFGANTPAMFQNNNVNRWVV